MNYRDQQKHDQQREAWMKRHGIHAEEAKPGVCVAWVKFANGAFSYHTAGLTRQEAMRKIAAKLKIPAWDE